MIDPVAYLKAIADANPNMRLAKALERLEIRQKSEAMRREIEAPFRGRDLNARTARNLREIADRLEGGATKEMRNG